MNGFLTALASPVAELRLERAGSVVVVQRLIISDQEPDPCPLPWWADSQPLDHQGSPNKCLLSLTVLACQEFGSSLLNGPGLGFLAGFSHVWARTEVI